MFFSNLLLTMCVFPPSNSTKKPTLEFDQIGKVRLQLFTDWCNINILILSSSLYLTLQEINPHLSTTPASSSLHHVVFCNFTVWIHQKLTSLENYNFSWEIFLDMDCCIHSKILLFPQGNLGTATRRTKRKFHFKHFWVA